MRHHRLGLCTHFRLFPMLLCGCLVVPATRTTTRNLGTRDGQVYEDADRGIELAASSRGSQVTVRAARIRDCHRDVYAVSEVRRDRHLELGGSDDPRARAFGVVLAPVLIPVSALVSGVSVLADGGSTAESTRVDHTEKLRCTRPADGLAVELVVPSGRVMHGTLDAHGATVLELTASEPYRGVAIARAEGVSTKIRFERTKPAVTAVRDAARECAASYLRTEAMRVVVVVDPKGAPAGLHITEPGANALAGDDDLAACIGAAIKNVTFPSSHRASTVVFPIDLTPRG
jgi:hypothetical protein